MFQLYMGKISIDLPMEESKKSWLFNNGLNTVTHNTWKTAVAGSISVSSSFKMLLQSFQWMLLWCPIIFPVSKQNKYPAYRETSTAAYNWKKMNIFKMQTWQCCVPKINVCNLFPIIQWTQTENYMPRGRKENEQMDVLMLGTYCFSLK